MGDIIQFNRNLNSSNNDIQNIFSEIISDLKISLKKVYPEEEELVFELEYFKSYISNMYEKSKERNWKNESKEKKYIEYYNSLKKDSKNLSDLNRTYFLSLFTYCSDINSSLLNEDKDYVKSIVESIDCKIKYNQLPKIKIIESVINDLTRPMIKELISKSPDSRFLLEDITEDLLNGNNIFNVYTLYRNVSNFIEDDNETLDIIREYFVREEKKRFFEKCSEESDIEKLKKEHKEYSIILNAISNIKNLKNDRYKDIYIENVSKILKKQNIDEEIINMVNLTRLYIEFGEQIEEFDEEDIEFYIQRGGKNENRRF